MHRTLPLTLLLFTAIARPAAADDGGKAPALKPVKPFAVEAVRDLAYRDGPDADVVRHKLDLYIPQGAKDFPVLVFVHGGTWRSGNKERYAGVGQIFARQGIGTAVINYRLSPAVQHPAHIEDVAKAFAWVHARIGAYGGRADRIFLCGHSAGGHLVALLATDDKYLKAEKLTPAAIRGVVGMSGVYVITPVSLFESAFGPDTAVCTDASPLSHVQGGHPPFLLLYADKDFKYLDQMAEQMGAALQRCACDAEVCKVEDRNHITIIAKMSGTGDPATEAIAAFIGKLAP
jgi:acetyl esterase/lipase